MIRIRNVIKITLIGLALMIALEILQAVYIDYRLRKLRWEIEKT